MPGGVARTLPFHAQLSKASYYTKRALARVDDPEVRKVRRLVARLRENPPDVLYLGDSTTFFVSPDDTDKRRLSKMIEDGLGERVSVLCLFGGSWHPALFAELVRLVADTGARPVIVVPLCARVRTVPWAEHPVFGHRQLVDYLRTLPDGAPSRSLRTSFPRPGEADFEVHYRRPHPTWLGDWTIGDHVRPLKDLTTLTGDERVRRLYAYHHGGAVPGSGPYLDDVTLLGTRLRALGTPTVVYETPIPVQAGSDYFGSPFTDLATRNLDLIAGALHKGIGEHAVVLREGTDYGTELFLDRSDASEHLNERGRLRLAAGVVDAVRAAR